MAEGEGRSLHVRDRPAAVLVDEDDTGRTARVSSPPLSFGQPQPVTARVVIIEEQNSGFFERLLEPY